MEGEKVATCMAYTVLKVHKNKLLKLKDMDSIVHYLQVKLQKDFGYDDDVVIKAYEQCSEDLRKAKMELPPPPAPEIEYPQKPFGVFVEPTKDEKIGHRKSDFSEIEKEVTDSVIKTWVLNAYSDRCDIKNNILQQARTDSSRTSQRGANDRNWIVWIEQSIKHRWAISIKSV